MKTIQTYSILIAEGEFKGYYRMCNIENKAVAEQLKAEFEADTGVACEVVPGRTENVVDFNDLF